MTSIMNTPGLLLVSLAFILLFLYRRRQSRMRANPRGLPYPPGPKPLPIIGNLFDLARENEIEAYLELSKKYGQNFVKNFAFTCANYIASHRRPCILHCSREENPFCQFLSGSK